MPGDTWQCQRYQPGLALCSECRVEHSFRCSCAPIHDAQWHIIDIFQMILRDKTYKSSPLREYFVFIITWQIFFIKCLTFGTIESTISQCRNNWIVDATYTQCEVCGAFYFMNDLAKVNIISMCRFVLALLQTRCVYSVINSGL